MPDPPIQLDEKRGILVGHIGEPVGVRNAELMPADDLCRIATEHRSSTVSSIRVRVGCTAA